MLGSPDTFDRFHFDETFELLIIWKYLGCVTDTGMSLTIAS